ncbi:MULTISPECIES: AAA family ATPase [unclassified Mesorhizobium]|uniref:AAA family ATPase n=1 Tax=unclassified Mesorhizobium TaxID=325217 RepID=UPI00115CFB3E|nr:MULTISPECIES: AAA family ATPase [unclassified Mesorhizobium]TRC90812.1 hypothetical protein FJV82_33505 [Mesorhizobium sp. WSM4305]
MARLESFSVEGLFGLFDHDIHFKLGDRITIIHAPNGYGKTIVLKLISGFFGGSFSIFRKVDFRQVNFRFDDGRILTITKRPDEQSNDKRKGNSTPPFTIRLHKSRKTLQEWTGWKPEGNVKDKREIYSIDRYIPHLYRLGPREYRDSQSGEFLSYYDAIEKYSDILPPQIRADLAPPEWVRDLRGSIHCQLIETQRLLLQRASKAAYERSELTWVSAVQDYSKELVTAIAVTLAESATVGSALDRTFPNRVLARLREPTAPLPESQLRSRLGELEQKRRRLTAVGLLDDSDEGAIHSNDRFDEPTRKFLSEYVSDAEKKLENYLRLLPRIELFIDIINRRFQFKKLSISRTSGFVFKNSRGGNLDQTPFLLENNMSSYWLMD